MVSDSDISAVEQRAATTGFSVGSMLEAVQQHEAVIRLAYDVVYRGADQTQGVRLHAAIDVSRNALLVLISGGSVPPLPPPTSPDGTARALLGLG